MTEIKSSPFDKEPAEGSRETVDKQLAQQQQTTRPDGMHRDRPKGNDQKTD
jgi:hypothetical protein